MDMRTLMVLAFLVGAAYAGPLSWDDAKCSQKCSITKAKFQYEPDKTYIYSYVSSNEVQLTDSSGDKVSVQMTATVEIGVLGDCEMIMQLRDVSLSNSESSSFVVFKSALEARPMAFSFEDGHVQQVCPSPQDKENQYVLNIKRAIISALQHSAKDLETKETVQETDISGVCTTVYEPSKGWASLTVVKTKDLKSCSKRLNSPITSFATPYSVESTLQNLPIVSGEQRCEQVISNHQIKNVKCSERTVFSPFNKNGKGIAVESRISLALTDTQDGVRNLIPRIESRSDLLFAANPEAQQESNERDARAVLEDLCQSTKDGVTPKTPFKIGKLVSVLRGLPMERISRIHDSLESKQLCSSRIVRDFFVDALSMAGTKGPIKYMAKLIKDDKISEVRAEAWFTMLAFNQNGDSESIRALIPFLKEEEKGGRQAILGISSFIYNFCNDEDTKEDCRDIPAVKEALAVLKSQLGSNCHSETEEDENRIILALAGFENIGRVGDAGATIKACFSEQNKGTIRHAAIRAFRRVPCGGPQKPALKMLEIYKDKSEGAEIRIYAYLGAMRCASPDVVRQVKQVLDKESVNQVGAFVWSHMKNMQETSAPLKQDIRTIVSDVDLQKKFSTDLRKFSRFIEWSAFSERLNVGGDVEMAIVRSPDAIIPKFVSLNISTQLFGEDLPVLEIGTHMRGLEHLMERYFGEEGMLSNLKIDDLLKLVGLGNDDDEDEENEVESSDRNTRSVNKLNRLNLLQERVNLKTEKTPKASVYLSILGRKIARFTSADLKELLSVKEAFDVMELLTQLAQKQKIERSMTVQFLDAEMTLPSISGMKISLELNGTATAAVKIDGKFDIRKLFTSERSAEIDGLLSPSAAVQIVALMSIDSGVEKPGLKAVFKAHTSQSVEGKVIINHGRIIDVKVNMPKDKIEVLSVSAKLFNVEKDGQEKQIVSRKYYDLQGCTKALNKPLGIEFCSKLHVPNPLLSEETPFVMALTDASLEITLEKRDNSMRGYEFHLELPSAHDYDNMVYKLEFDTPGSKIDRHFALEGKVNSKDNEHTANVKLISPIKKMVASASIVNRPELKRARLSTTIDDSKQYTFESEVKVKRQSGQVEYQPSVTISMPRSEPITVTGTYSYTTGRKQQISIDLRSNRPSNKPAFIKGTITKDGDFSHRNPQGKLRIATDLSFSTPLLESRVHGTVDKQEAVIATDLSVEYKLQGYSRHTTKLISKIQNQSSRHLTKLTVLKEITFTQFPENNLRVAWNFLHKEQEHLENEITLHHGEKLDSDENKYHLLQVSKLEGLDHHGLQGKISNRLALNTPSLDEEVELTLESEWDFVQKPKFNIKADLKNQKNRHMTAAVDFSYKTSKPIEMHMEAKLTTPTREMIYQDTLREKSPNEFEGKTLVQWQRGQRATVDYVYRMKSDSTKMHHEVELKMKTPSMRIPMQNRVMLKATRDNLDLNTHVHYEGRPVYTIDAKLSRDGESKVEIKLDDWEAEIEFQDKDESTEGRFDLQNEKEDIHLLGSARYGSEERGAKRSLDIQGSYNPEKDPSRSFQFSSALKKTSRKPIKYNVMTSLKVGKYYSAKIQGDLASDLLDGPIDITIDLDGKRMKPISLNLQHNIEDDSMTCAIRYTSDNEEKLHIAANGKYETSSSELEVQWGVAVRSAYRSLNGKEFHVSFKQDVSSPKYNLNIRVQEEAGKPYNLNLEYNEDESRYTTKARAHGLLTTPIPEYRSQEATIITELGRALVHVNVDATSSQGKRVAGILNIKREGAVATGSLQMDLPIRNLRSLKLNSVVDYSNDYSMETQVEANGKTKAEWSLKMDGGDKPYAHIKAMSNFGPKYELKVDAVADKKRNSFEHSLSRNGAEFSSSHLMFQKQNKNYDGHVQLKHENWVGAIEMRNENRSPVDRVYQLSTKGLGEPITIELKFQQEGKVYTPELTVCLKSRPSECLEVKATYNNDDKPYQKVVHREMEVKVTQGSDVDLIVRFEHKQDKESMEQNFELESFRKTIGYDIELEDKDDKSTALFRVKLPSRQMLAKAELETKDDKIEASAEFLSDELRQPDNKLEIELTHESNDEKDGSDVVHSTLVVKHPVFERPIKIDFEAQSHEGDVLRPVQAKLEIDVTSDPSKKIMLMAYLEKPNKDDSNITAFFNIYQTDRHDLDIMLRGHLGNLNERLTTGLEWRYAYEGQKYEGNDLLIVDKAEEEVHYFLRCPVHQVEGHGSWEYSKNKLFKLDMNVVNGDDQSEAKFVVDISKPCAELTLFSEPGTVSSRYHTCIDSQGRSLLTITAESYQGTEKQTDATIVFDRRDGKVFNAHVHWRPEMIGEMAYQMMEWSEGSPLEFNTDKVMEEISSKAEVLVRDFNIVVAKPFGQYLIRESKAISRELSSDLSEARDALEKLAEYWPNWDVLYEEYVPEAVQRVVREVYEYIEELFEEFTPFSCEYGTMCYTIKYAYNRHGFEGLVEYIYSTVENMPSGYYRLMITLKDYTLSHVRLPTIDWEPIMNKLEEIYEWIEEAFEPIYNSELVKKVLESADDLSEYISEAISGMSEELMNRVEAYLEEFLDTPEAKVVIEALDAVTQQIVKELKNLHLDQTLNKIIDFSREYFSAEALKNSVRLITMEPEKGQIQIEIRLPADDHEIRDTILQSVRKPFTDDLISKASNPIKQAKKTLKGIHNAAKQDWLPPFKGQGQIVAGMHYKTFDNSFYDFAGQCSYLLASDFENQNFSVILRYDGEDNNGGLDKSLLIVVGKQVIEIDPDDETVKIDDQDAELPIVTKHVSVFRQGNVIVVDSRRGLSVTCNLVRDFCSTSISGWYHGKTRGLFGNFDNEQNNEYTKPRGEQASNKETFARSWEVASSCKYRNLVRDVEIDTESSKYDICREHFENDDSPMSDCFEEVDAKEYLRMCIRQVSIQRNADDAACNVAAAYKDICESRKIDVTMPTTCIKCQAIDGADIESGDQQVFKGVSPQTADVVFVIEEKECNQAIVKDMDSVTRIVERELTNNGLTNNRYGIVAFGGKDEKQKAHSHTARGKIFFESKDLILAAERIQFAAQKKGSSDAFSAIMEAIQYPFRAGASKTLVLLTCTQCDEQYMKVDYSEIQNMLLEHGIILHTLSNRDIKIKGSGSKGKNLYGVDANTVYNAKAVSQKDLTGTPDLRAQVSVPKDICVALAQEVHGSFFTTKPLIEGQANEAKNWKSLFARRLVKTAEPHQCQKCECIASDDDVPMTVCKPCKTPSPKLPAKTYVEEEDYD